MVKEQEVVTEKCSDTDFGLTGEYLKHLRDNVTIPTATNIADYQSIEAIDSNEYPYKSIDYCLKPVHLVAPDPIYDRVLSLREVMDSSMISNCAYECTVKENAKERKPEETITCRRNSV